MVLSNGIISMWYVYILKSQQRKWYYVGSTNRLAERIDEHNRGKVTSTKHFLPFILVFKKEFVSEKEARHYEKILKVKRKEKEKIIWMIE